MDTPLAPLASSVPASEHAGLHTALLLLWLTSTPTSLSPSDSTSTSTAATATATTSTTATATTTATTTAPADAGRIYFSPLRASEGVDETTRQLLEDAILVASRKRNPRVIGTADLATILSVEAARQTIGCSTTGCDVELADALGAPELLSGQLSRSGDTWVLSMSRLERETLTVVARAQVNRTGSSGIVLLDAVPELVDALFGIEQTTWSPVVTAGAVTAGVGTGVAVVGGILYLVSFLKFEDGQKAIRDDDLQKAADIRQTYEPLSNAGLVAVGVGAAGVVVGAVVLGLGLASEQP